MVVERWNKILDIKKCNIMKIILLQLKFSNFGTQYKHLLNVSCIYIEYVLTIYQYILAYSKPKNLKKQILEYFAERLPNLIWWIYSQCLNILESVFFGVFGLIWPKTNKSDLIYATRHLLDASANYMLDTEADATRGHKLVVSMY